MCLLWFLFNFRKAELINSLSFDNSNYSIFEPFKKNARRIKCIFINRLSNES
jgi:hypothetical protein